MMHCFKRSGLWMFAIALLMAAQVALALHTVDHQFSADATASEHCTLCHTATAMAPAPVAEAPAPVLDVLATAPEATVSFLVPATSVAGFRSRAPPASLV